LRQLQEENRKLKQLVTQLTGDQAVCRYQPRHLFHQQPAPEAKPLASYVRKHWTVANQLHWSLDVNCIEDSSRIPGGNGAAIFGYLRRIVLSVIKRDTPLTKTSQRAKRLKAGWSVKTSEW
jgi:predicted transposase YbfD/YdcC